MSVFNNPAFDHHEHVAFREDPASGLKAIIAVHNTTLGPAVGGCRMFPYASDDAALYDVLRLSRGMTYKSALAGLPFGGGKSVIIGDPKTDKTPALLHAMGEFVDSLGGRYAAAEDSGISVPDVRLMAERTPHVGGFQDGLENGGDPSPTTAYGVFLGIRTAVQYRLGGDSMKGLRVAIQGLGNVGFHLAGLLVKEGAVVYGADINPDNLRRAVDVHGITVVSTEEIFTVEADVFAPCALGGALTRDTIDGLRAGIVAGAANNQLAEESGAEQLWDRGILFCPDFLINAGGIIDVYHQRLGSEPAVKREHVERIESNLQEILFRSDRAGHSPHLIAEEVAREYLAGSAAEAPRVAAF